MKVFFSASPRALKNDEDSFRAIYNEIEKLGHKNLSELVIDNDVDKFYGFGDDEREKHYKVTMDHIRNADIIVIEASIHSLAMGYIVEKALNSSKQVICLYKGNNDPFFFSGISDENLQILKYSKLEIPTVVKEAFDYASNIQDIRFNMILPNKMDNFIKKTSKQKNISRASYIRSLISEKMNN